MFLFRDYFQHKTSVEQLATMLTIGRRTLERRFKASTSNTIAEYLQRVKIEAAKKEFEMTGKSLSEVMFHVGYNDFKGFRNIFKSRQAYPQQLIKTNIISYCKCLMLNVAWLLYNFG